MQYLLTSSRKFSFNKTHGSVVLACLKDFLQTWAESIKQIKYLTPVSVQNLFRVSELESAYLQGS